MVQYLLSSSKTHNKEGRTAIEVNLSHYLPVCDIIGLDGGGIARPGFPGALTSEQAKSGGTMGFWAMLWLFKVDQVAYPGHNRGAQWRARLLQCNKRKALLEVK